MATRQGEPLGRFRHVSPDPPRNLTLTGLSPEKAWSETLGDSPFASLGLTGECPATVVPLVAPTVAPKMRPRVQAVARATVPLIPVTGQVTRLPKKPMAVLTAVPGEAS